MRCEHGWRPPAAASGATSSPATAPDDDRAPLGEGAWPWVLLALADLLERDTRRLTELEVAETGKPVPVFRDGELPFAVDNLRFFAGFGRSLEGSGAGELSRGYTLMVVRRPVGVVAGIAPWDFPLVMAVWKLGPALAAGNTVVLEPAPGTAGTTLRLAQLAVEAGIPAGALNVVTGGAEVGEALVRDPRVAMVSTTGSTAAGARRHGGGCRARHPRAPRARRQGPGRGLR